MLAFYLMYVCTLCYIGSLFEHTIVIYSSTLVVAAPGGSTSLKISIVFTIILKFVIKVSFLRLH